MGDWTCGLIHSFYIKITQPRYCKTSDKKYRQIGWDPLHQELPFITLFFSLPSTLVSNTHSLSLDWFLVPFQRSVMILGVTYSPVLKYHSDRWTNTLKEIGISQRVHVRDSSVKTVIGPDSKLVRSYSPSIPVSTTTISVSSGILKSSPFFISILSSLLTTFLPSHWLNHKNYSNFLTTSNQWYTLLEPCYSLPTSHLRT